MTCYNTYQKWKHLNIFSLFYRLIDFCQISNILLLFYFNRIKCFLFYFVLNRNQIVLFVKCLSQFLHPTEATLLLISKPKSGVGGSTMAFALKEEVLNFKAIVSQLYFFYLLLLLVLRPYNVRLWYSCLFVSSQILVL